MVKMKKSKHGDGEPDLCRYGYDNEHMECAGSGVLDLYNHGYNNKLAAKVAVLLWLG